MRVRGGSDTRFIIHDDWLCFPLWHYFANLFGLYSLYID